VIAAAREAERQKLSAFIDFDRAVWDPSDPRRFRPGFAAPDHLHPNDAGHEAMGVAVKLNDLECHRK